MLSRRLGRGRGAQVGGKLAYRLRPRTLSDLAVGRRTALVSATNGKSTTATLLAAATATLGPVAFNRTGANMEEGLVVALDADRRRRTPSSRPTRPTWVLSCGRPDRR